jgi:hypothetical protein
LTPRLAAGPSYGCPHLSWSPLAPFPLSGRHRVYRTSLKIQTSPAKKNGRSQISMMALAAESKIYLVLSILIEVRRKAIIIIFDDTCHIIGDWICQK